MPGWLTDHFLFLTFRHSATQGIKVVATLQRLDGEVFSTKNIAQKHYGQKNKAINQNITEPLQNRQDSYTPPLR